MITIVYYSIQSMVNVFTIKYNFTVIFHSSYLILIVLIYIFDIQVIQY